MGEKPFRIWFDKIDGFIKIDNGIKYLVLLKYNEIYNSIQYLTGQNPFFSHGENTQKYMKR